MNPCDDLAGVHAALAALADPAARIAAFAGEVAARGGSMVLPRPGETWGPHWVELSLMGVLGTGDSGSEALTEWMACAARQVAYERCTVPSAAESLLTGDLIDIPFSELLSAARDVRLHSRNPDAIALAARIERLIADRVVA